MNIWEGEPQVAREEAAAYIQRWGLEGTVLLDDTAAYARALGVRGVPTNVYVGADGIVRAVGATTSDALLVEAARLEPRLMPEAAAGSRQDGGGAHGGGGGGNGSGRAARPLMPSDFAAPQND